MVLIGARAWAHLIRRIWRRCEDAFKLPQLKLQKRDSGGYAKINANGVINRPLKRFCTL
jgi:hypothetical protein